MCSFVYTQFLLGLFSRDYCSDFVGFAFDRDCLFFIFLLICLFFLPPFFIRLHSKSEHAIEIERCRWNLRTLWHADKTGLLLGGRERSCSKNRKRETGERKKDVASYFPYSKVRLYSPSPILKKVGSQVVSLRLDIWSVVLPSQQHWRPLACREQPSL